MSADCQGDINGDFQGGIRGDFQGDINGDFQGGIRGDFQGDRDEDFQGGIRGDFQGDRDEDFQGDIRGDFQGDRKGSPLHIVSCIILVGGRSSRMGKDKALLPFPGDEQTSFVEHLVSVLVPIGREVLLVAHDETQASAYASLRNVRIVTDQMPNCGPLVGLYSGLSAMHTASTCALVVAVDMPFVQPALAAYLLSQAQGDSILVPMVEDIPQVLLAVYPRSLLPVIEQCLREGRRDPRSLLKVAPVRYVDEAQLRAVDPQLRSFINVNTPEELRAIQPV